MPQLYNDEPFFESENDPFREEFSDEYVCGDVSIKAHFPPNMKAKLHGLYVRSFFHSLSKTWNECEGKYMAVAPIGDGGLLGSIPSNRLELAYLDLGNEACLDIPIIADECGHIEITRI